VFLQGEAEFTVRHTPDRRKFIVKTGWEFSVEVLGTEFIVYNRRRSQKVVLASGKVRVHYPQDGKMRDLTMQPGDLVTLNPHRKLDIRPKKDPRQYAAWK
jgi:ferric-dicitrate binding protein FerR (iron transport regulator)